MFYCTEGIFFCPYKRCLEIKLHNENLAEGHFYDRLFHNLVEICKANGKRKNGKTVNEIAPNIHSIMLSARMSLHCGDFLFLCLCLCKRSFPQSGSDFVKEILLALKLKANGILAGISQCFIHSFIPKCVNV